MALQVGSIASDRKGVYKVIASSFPHTTITVRYRSGEIAVKDKAIAEKIYENMRRESRHEKTRAKEEEVMFLDTWWRRYPAFYEHYWKPHIMGRDMMEQLKQEVPEVYDAIWNWAFE